MSMKSPSTVYCAAGSYEGSLFVWEVNSENSKCDKIKMTAGFSCSRASIKAIAISASAKFLVCGGMDEKIRIYNLIDGNSVGELSTHTGAITSLQFFEDSFLLSASEDGTICIWRVHDWNCLHILGGHKNIIQCLSIHPTGKLALSVSKDSTMKLWNLLEGRIAFTRGLKGIADRVHWEESTGNYYLITMNKDVKVFSTSENTLTGTLCCNGRVNQALFFPSLSGSSSTSTSSDNDNSMGVLVINEGGRGSLELFTITGTQLYAWDIGSQLSGRPRDMTMTPYRSNSNSSNDIHIASSSSIEPTTTSESTGTTTTTTTATTTGTLPQSLKKKKKKKRKLNSDSEHLTTGEEEEEEVVKEEVVADTAGIETSNDSSTSTTVSKDKDIDHIITIIGSSGKLLLLSLSELVAKKPLLESLLSALSVPAEPRLTCVTSWRTLLPSSHQSKVSNNDHSSSVPILEEVLDDGHKNPTSEVIGKNHINTNTGSQNSDEIIANSSTDINNSNKKKKKNKKKKRKSLNESILSTTSSE